MIIYIFGSSLFFIIHHILWIKPATWVFFTLPIQRTVKLTKCLFESLWMSLNLIHEMQIIITIYFFNVIARMDKVEQHNTVTFLPFNGPKIWLAWLQKIKWIKIPIIHFQVLFIAENNRILFFSLLSHYCSPWSA